MDTFNPFADAWNDNGHDADKPAPFPSFSLGSSDTSQKTGDTAAHGTGWGASEAIASPSKRYDDDDQQPWGPPSSAHEPGVLAEPAVDSPTPAWTRSTESHIPKSADDDTSAWTSHDEVLPAWSGDSASSDTRNPTDPDVPHEEPGEQAQPSALNQGFGPSETDYSIPTASHAVQSGNDDEDGWGPVELPASKWEEDLSKPPVWGPSESVPVFERNKGEGVGEDVDSGWHTPDQRDDSGASAFQSRWPGGELSERIEAFPDTQRDRLSSEGASSSYVRNRYGSREIKLEDYAPATAPIPQNEVDELEMLKQLGISVRNLDEESRPAGLVDASKSQAQTSVEGTLATEDEQPKTSRWSIFARKPAAPATGMSSITGSIRPSTEGTQASLPSRPSSARPSVDGSARPGSPATASPRPSSSNGVSEQPASPNAAGQALAQAQTQGAKWFRFGAKKAAADASEPPSAPTPTDLLAVVLPAASRRTAAVTTSKPSTPNTADLFDDFGQLENFDSRKTSTSNPQKPTASLYDDFELPPGAEEDPSTKGGWSFWSGRSASAAHSVLGANSGLVTHANDGEVDLDNIFEAFEKAPSVKDSRSEQAEQGVRDASDVMVGLEDPYSVLGVGATSSRPRQAQRARVGSVTRSPNDPLDPLSSYNRPPLITSASKQKRIPSRTASPSPVPSPTPASRISPLVQPLPSSTRPSSSVVLPFRSPPLLAPPPGSSSILRKVSPTPSLLDDFGDFSDSPVPSSSLHLNPAHSSAAGNAAGQDSLHMPFATTGHKPPPAASSPASLLELDDEFGDFTASTAKQSPKKAAGPMKLGHSATGSNGHTPGGSLSQQDLTFFDSL